MASVKVFDSNAQEVGQIDLDPRVFDVEPNPFLLQEVVRAQLAGRRQGTASTQTRAEVSRTGARVWRQKGTGRARHGSRRVNLWVGGGVTFGPHPRDYSFKPPKKVWRSALRMALTDRARGDGTLVVLESFDLPEAKTKAALAALAPVTGGRKALVVLPEGNNNAYLALRNVPHMTVKEPARLNVYDILRHEVLVLTRQSAESVMEALR